MRNKNNPLPSSLFPPIVPKSTPVGILEVGLRGAARLLGVVLLDGRIDRIVLLPDGIGAAVALIDGKNLKAEIMIEDIVYGVVQQIVVCGQSHSPVKLMVQPVAEDNILGVEISIVIR